MHSTEKILEYYATEPVLCTQYRGEFSQLLDLMLQFQPRTFLELGTHYGGTLYQWLMFAPVGGKVVAVDDYHINNSLYDKWRRGRILRWYLGKTQDAEIVEKVREEGPFDFLFIDADHAYHAALTDWNNYSTMMNPNKDTLIAFHDIIPHKNTEVDRLWNEIKGHYEHWEFVEDKEQSGCGIGVLRIPKS